MTEYHSHSTATINYNYKMNRHISNLESLHSAGAFANVTALKAIDTSSATDYPAFIWAYVDGEGEYFLDRVSALTESLPTIAKPVTGSGYWVKKTNTNVTANNLIKQVGTLWGSIGSITTSTVPEGSNLYFTEARVRSTPLTGFSASNSAITATDNLLQALSKTQGQLDNRLLLSGGTLTGALTLSGDPASALQASTKQYTDTKLPLAGGTLTGALTLSADPVSLMQASTKQYTDSKLALVGGTLTGALTLAADPSAALQASTKQYTDTKLPLAGGALTGTLVLNADPLNPLEAATKRYVDTAIQGLDSKPSVKAATTANITLSGTQTIDGIALSVNDRVLVKDQTTTSQNGLYVVQSSAWTRALDMDTWSEVPGSFAFVEQGTINNNTGWTCTSDQGGTIGTTAIVFAQFSAAGAYTTDGQGIILTGNQFSLQLNGSTLSKSGSGLQVASGGITNTEISSSAAIARTKLASGTANQVVVNDGSGNFSSVSSLPFTQGGTGLTALGTANQLMGVNAAATGLEYKSIAFTNGSVVNAANLLTLSIPQAIDTAASPTFSGLTLNGTGQLQLPNGTTAQRAASPVNGMIRYNSTNSKLEAYENGVWINVVGTGSTDYSMEYTIAGNLALGVIASVGNNGSVSFTTPIGFAVPIGMTLVDISVNLGSFQASAAATLSLQIRQLTTTTAGVSLPISTTSGTLMQTVTYTTAGSSAATFHRTKTVNGLSVGFTAGNVIFVVVSAFTNCSAADMVMSLRFKQ
jgi:hypothetical protein